MKTTIIAVGNGGYNLASDIINANIFPESKFIVCDTDKQSLESNKANADEIFLLDKLRGKVTASMTDLVDDIVVATTDTIVVCATFGGRTGSRYAPLIALNAILRGKFVCSFFSTNFSFEGEKHGKRSDNARMQSVAASNFIIQQNNNRLKAIDYLGLGDMNKPIVETAASALQTHSLEELSMWSRLESIQDLIPAEYRLSEIPLIWIRSDCYRGIDAEGRKEVFNLYA